MTGSDIRLQQSSCLHACADFIRVRALRQGPDLSTTGEPHVSDPLVVPDQTVQPSFKPGCLGGIVKAESKSVPPRWS